MNKKGRMRNIILRGSIIFLVIMLSLGVSLEYMTYHLLLRHVENQVAQQAQTLAQISGEKLAQEHELMVDIAALLTSGQFEILDIMEAWEQTVHDSRVGLITLNGEAVYGEHLNLTGFEAVRDAIRGTSSVSYDPDLGLLFTSPVMEGGNVHYILYRLYDQEDLANRFEVTGYSGRARTVVLDRNRQVVIPYSTWNQQEKVDMLETASHAEAYEKALSRMTYSGSAAVAIRSENQLLFMAEVTGTDFYLVGTVPRQAVVGSTGTIYALIFWVMSAMIILFILVVYFLFRAEKRAVQSDQFMEAKESAENANRAKSNFLANMSHEIRTPINAIMGMNEMILRESNEPQTLEYATNVDHASHTLLALVNDILDFSKIESGRMELVDSNYNLSNLLADVSNIIAVKAEQKGLDYQVEVEPDLPNKLRGDEVRVRQILLHLLNNAVKYTSEGAVRLKVGGTYKGSSILELKLQVEDTGIGIERENIGKLFRDFERLELDRNRSIQGNGLGLAIVKDLVNRMDGNITVTSEYGVGSVFTAYIRQTVMDMESIGDFGTRIRERSQAQADSYEAFFTAPDARILVVDDNEMNLFVVTNLLKSTRIRIDTAASGQECLNLLSRNYYDVVFLDHLMPVMDGIETLHRAKEIPDMPNPNVTFICLTANAYVGIREKYLKDGFTDYISKPLESGTLENILVKYLPAKKILMNNGEQAPVSSAFESAPLAGSGAGQGNGRASRLLDHAVGVKYCGNSEDILKELLAMFCEQYEVKTKALRETLEAQDWPEFIVTAHGLKSTALNVGAVTLSKAAKDMEFAGKAKVAGDRIFRPETEDGEWAPEDYVREHIDKLLELYRDTYEEAKGNA
jgi:signal transduction histidine kinase/HPt (histidine-containing phosphotransfer) domain-containing protein/ActR/RegA family two-component response regulator